MKQLRKDMIIRSDSLGCTRLERDILRRSRYPFLVGLDYVFQTPVNVYFVMKFYRYKIGTDQIGAENCTDI